MNGCEEFARLEHEVRSALQNLTFVTSAALEAFRAGDHAKFTELDTRIENLVGQKERTLGALRQHAKDHHCQSVV